MNSKETWKQYFLKNNLDNLWSEILASYAESLLSKKLPVIFEIEHLSLLLGVEKLYLYRIIYSSYSFYRPLFIKKRKGGIRELHAPYPQLAYIQKWIKSNILDHLELSQSSFAYSKGNSIFNNASHHLHGTELLRLDIEDFFFNISIRSVEKVFINLGYTEKLSHQLSQLCCFDNFLPQGACTSPILSNLICAKMDEEIEDFVKNFNLKYSRYADDIYISGGNL